jgi:TRAP transporter TAXI family solute receptor
VRGLVQRVCLPLLALMLAGCARGPDTAGLQRDVQQQLDTLFDGRVLEVTSLKRQGSAPLAGTSGGKQAVVYYNAVLTFTAPYDPSDWTTLSPERIADALGATDEGVIGLGGGSIDAGTRLRAYGSLVYRRAGDGWEASLLPSPAAKPAPAASAGGSPLVRSNELIDRLANVVNTTRGLHAADDAIVAEELDNALQNIKLRLNRGEAGLVIATGPASGEYARFIEALRPRGVDWAVLQANTAGSVANALMLDAGEARFALVQSDVAAAAVTGQGAFANSGPLRHLRAVAALFPEPVHVVVQRDAGIAELAGLAGRRIAIGSRGSGTRHTALQVLRAHGIDPGEFVAVDARDPEEALSLLAAGRIDAVIEVVSVPWRKLDAVAAKSGLALLPLEAGAMVTLGQSTPGLVPLAIPARSYAWQDGAVPTLAATALLVASDDVPASSVRRTLDFLFQESAALDRGVTASRLSEERALTGITIPLHDGSVEYFKAGRSSGLTSDR